MDSNGDTNEVIILGYCCKSFMRGRVISVKGVCHCIDTCSGGSHEPKILVSMIRILQTHMVRTEHAKEVRRLKGTNNYKDKVMRMRYALVSQCIGTFLTDDNYIVNEYV